MGSINNTNTAAFSLYYLLHGCLVLLPGLATSQVMMDVLRVTPAEMSFVASLMWLPWAFKPLVGYVSDHFPVFGYRRLPYLIAGIVINAALWFAIWTSLPLFSHANRVVFYSMLFACYTAFVLSETIVDALIAEKAQQETAQDSGRLQSGIWTMDAAGSVLSTIAVTLAFSDSSTGTSATRASAKVFFACGLLTALFIIAIPWIHDAHIASIHTASTRTAETSHTRQDEEHHDLLSSQSAATVPLNPADAQEEKEEEEEEEERILPTLSSVLSDSRLVKCLVFVLVVSSSPTSGDAMFYFQRDTLHFSLEFIAWTSVVRTLLNFLSSFSYYKWWRKVEYYVVFRNAVLMRFIVGVVNVLVVERWNVHLGIPDHVFIFGDTVAQGIAGEIIFLPVAVLAAKLAPKGLEGTVYATTMSVLNVSWMLSSFYSGIISSAFGVREGHYERLTSLIVVTNLISLLPLFFLRWVPSINAATLDDGEYSFERIHDTQACDKERSNKESTETKK